MKIDYKDLFATVEVAKDRKEMALELQMVGRACARAGEWYLKTLYLQDAEAEKQAERERKAALGHGYRRKKQTVEEMQRELAELEAKLAQVTR